MKIDVRIPGFKGGTYEVKMEGQEHVPLVSKGIATQIENLKPVTKATCPIYDLQGRKIANGLRKGIYIKNGKKGCD